MRLFTQVILTFLPTLVHGSVIVPGAAWTDTSGNSIQAHGGGFLKVSLNSLGSSSSDHTSWRLDRPITGLAKINRTTAPCSKRFPATRLLLITPDSRMGRSWPSYTSPLIWWLGLVKMMHSHQSVVPWFLRPISWRDPKVFPFFSLSRIDMPDWCGQCFSTKP